MLVKKLIKDKTGKREREPGKFPCFVLFPLLFFLLSACHNPFFPPKAEKTGGGEYFVENAAITIDAIDITVTPPVKGEVPAAAIGGEDNFTLSLISWAPEDNPFEGCTEYTVTITLTADDDYFFAENLSVKLNNVSIASPSVAADTVTFSHKFQATLDKTVTGIAVKNQPKLAYTHGDPLDLSLLVVTLTIDDYGIPDTEDIAFGDFDDCGSGIITNFADGITLSRTNHDSKKITVTFGSLPPAETNALTVAKAGNTLAISCADTTYGGSAPNPSATANTSGGSMSYEYKVQGAADSAYTTTVPANAGNYTVRGASAATANYNAATATANFTINLATLAGTVSITRGGAAITAPVAVDEQLTASYSGGETVSYQWKKDGVNISGATSQTYTPSTAGSYTVTVSAANYISSTSAAVTVKDSAAASISFPDIANGAPELEGYADIEFSRADGIQTIALEDPEQYTEVHWYISGTTISQSYTEPITNGDFIFDPADFAAYANGKYFLTIDVCKTVMVGGAATDMWYNTTIEFDLVN